MNQIRVSNAIIEDISRDGKVTYVTITYNNRGEQTVKLIVTRDTVIRNENGFPVAVRELQEGMIVDAVFSSAMTRSIPPQANAFRIRIVKRPIQTQTTVGRIIQIDARNQSITTIDSHNLRSVIQFNLAPDAKIFGIVGRPIELRDLWIGAQVRVEHANFMTASIPPQTTAFTIRVIG